MLATLRKKLVWVLSHPVWMGIGVLIIVIPGLLGLFDLWPPPDQEDQSPPQAQYTGFISQMNTWRNDPKWVRNKEHTDRWDRVLLTFGEPASDTSLAPMTATEAQGYADRDWPRWVPVAKALKAIVTGSSGVDMLQGTSAGELLVGLGGADTLNGLDGNDELRGGNGADTYTGGAGKDRFVFFSGETGGKTLTDFASGDVIVLKGDSWLSAGDIVASVQALGTGNYRYTLADGLTVKTTNNRTLRTEDFVVEQR